VDGEEKEFAHGSEPYHDCRRVQGCTGASNSLIL
jgi:hypothetical protein